MTRTSFVFPATLMLCMIGWTSLADAQSHGIAENNLLTKKKSADAILSSAFGSAASLHKVATAELSGDKVDGQGKSEALLKALSATRKLGVSRLQPLENKVNIQRYIDRVDWDTAFDGMEFKQKGPSKGRMSNDEAFNSQIPLEGLFDQKRSHGITEDVWSVRTDVRKGLE